MSLQLIKIIFQIISVIQIVQSSIDYCKLNCEIDGEIFPHTVCNNTCEAVEGCKAIKLDDDLRQWIVDIHNELRDKVAIGNETRKNLTRAANMNLLEYDKELETIAQCHINKCKYMHDKCRRTEKFKEIGQNLHTGISGTSLATLHDVKGVVYDWYNEIEKINPLIIDHFDTPPNPNVAHFTQVIWAKSLFIGCGISQSKSKELFLTCNYGPGGNFDNLPVYTRGKPCSACAEGFECDNKYKGLCRQIPKTTTTMFTIPSIPKNIDFINPVAIPKTINSSRPVDSSSIIIFVTTFCVMLLTY